MKNKLDKYVIGKVRERRHALKVSQRGIAAAIGRERGFVGQVESEKFDHKYSVYQLYLIANALDCEVSDFFPRPDDPEFELEKEGRVKKRSVSKRQASES